MRRRDDERPTPQHHLTVDMGSTQTLKGFLCTPRTDGPSTGLIRSYTFSVSEDGQEWKQVSQSRWMPYWTEVDFEPCQARYFKLTSDDRWGASIAEIDVY